MRVHNAVLLATAAFLASFDGTLASEMMELNSPATVHSLHNVDSTGTQRFLRIESRTDEDEDRAISLPGTGKLADLLEEGTSKLVQSARNKAWLVKGTTADDAFAKLELNTAGSKIFEDSKFITWAVFVTKVEKQNPEATILAELSNSYTPDTLAKMIAAAKKVSKTEGLATMLQIQQIHIWLSAGKSTDDVFNLLKLNDAGAKLFESPQFTTWTSYVDAFNKKDPNNEVSIFKKLTKSYDDATLSKMVEGAMKVPSTEMIATKLQAQQNQRWLSKGKSTDDVFKLLKLDDPDISVLVDPRLNAMTSYMKVFNKANPGMETTLITTLTNHYEDLGLAQLLKEALKVSSTKKISEDLQFAQFERWFDEGKIQDDVFKLLKLEQSAWRTDPDTVILRQYNKFFKAHFQH